MDVVYQVASVTCDHPLLAMAILAVAIVGLAVFLTQGGKYAPAATYVKPDDRALKELERQTQLMRQDMYNRNTPPY